MISLDTILECDRRTSCDGEDHAMLCVMRVKTMRKAYNHIQHQVIRYFMSILLYITKIQS